MANLEFDGPEVNLLPIILTLDALLVIVIPRPLEIVLSIIVTLLEYPAT